MISDTHIPDDAPALPFQVLRAFAGVDAILHAGDVYEPDVLEELGEIAPVWAARGNGDDGSGGRAVQPFHERLRSEWLLEIGGLTVGLVHELPIPEDPLIPADTVASAKRRLFPGVGKIDVIVYGDSHVEAIDVIDGTLCINPGSPTLPHNLLGRLGTIGMLRVEDGVAAGTLLQLTPDGVVAIATS